MSFETSQPSSRWLGNGGLLQALKSAPLKCISGVWADCHRCDNYQCLGGNLAASNSLMTSLTSNQVGLPAELKHINKRRKKKLTRIPLVTASEAGKAQI